MLAAPQVIRYEQFIKENMQLGYATAFVECGDFYRAQDVLESGLVKSFHQWVMQEGRYLRTVIHEGRPWADVFLTKAVRAGLTAVSVEAGDAPGASFSKSPKLLSKREAVDLLTEFEAEERKAIVLLYVEEAPAARVRHWLSVSQEYIEALNAKLEERLRSWTPADPHEESTMDYFRRTLRQYRLPAQFHQVVSGQLRSSAGGVESTFRNVIISAAALVVSYAVIKMIFYLDEDRYGYGYGRGAMSQLGAFSMLVTGHFDFAGTIFMFLLHRALQINGRRVLVLSKAKYLLPALGACAYTGIGFFLVWLGTILLPDMLEDLMDFTSLYYMFLIHKLWQMASVALTVYWLYCVALYSFDGFERLVDSVRLEREDAAAADTETAE